VCEREKTRGKRERAIESESERGRRRGRKGGKGGEVEE